MHSRRTFTVLLLLTVFLPAAVHGQEIQDAERSLLVSADLLAALLSDDQVRIVDVRAQDEYSQAHIPGAVWADISAWKSLAAAEGGLTDADRWSKLIGELGISSDQQVVVYGDKLSDAARVWWLLSYVGVEKAKLLDGGWQWWTQENRPTEDAPPKVLTSEFRAEFQTDRLAEMESVKASLDSDDTKIVDTRSDREFAAGRIPNSVQLEWSNLVKDDGRFKTREELNDIFREKGILPASTAVCY